MVNVYCVKWGTKYDRSFVENLKTSIEKHFTIEHKFMDGLENHGTQGMKLNLQLRIVM